MGRITEDMARKIRAEYANNPSYKAVAEKCGLNWKTVKIHVKRSSCKAQTERSSVAQKETVGQSGDARSFQKTSIDTNGGISLTSISSPMLAVEASITTSSSKAARAYGLFAQGKTPLEVALQLDAAAPDVERWYAEYLRLSGLAALHGLYLEVSDGLLGYLGLYRRMKSEKMNSAEFTSYLKSIKEIRSIANELERRRHDLAEADERKKGLDEQVQETEDRLTTLRQDCETAKNKIEVQMKQLALLQEETRRMEERRLVLLRVNDGLARNEVIPRISQAVTTEVNALLSSRRYIWGAALLSAVQTLQQNPHLLDAFYHPRITADPRAPAKLANEFYAFYAETTDRLRETLLRKIQTRTMGNLMQYQ